MARSAARKPKPVVFVFQLGKNAKAGKYAVPSAYTAIPCYLYRESEGARTRHLDTIAEADVAPRDAETLFAAIEVMVERCELLRELSSDVDIDGGKSPAYTTGFHPSATVDEACAALARGGFGVVRFVDPLAAPAASSPREAGLSRALQDLARALDHASLASVLAATRSEGELGYHASGAEHLVAEGLVEPDAKAFAAGVEALAPGLDADARGTLVVLVARVVRAAKGEAADGARALLAALPAAEDAGVKKLLDGWQLSRQGPASGAPSTPTSIA